MRTIRRFSEFVDSGVVKRQKPDLHRPNFLIEEAERGYKSLIDVLEKIGINNNNANTLVKSCYDILMSLIRSKMLLEGYNSSGFGAHEAEISYLAVLGFNERDIEFADQLRHFRNGILYYGTMLDTVYAEKVVLFLKTNYPKLSGIGDNHGK